MNLRHRTRGQSAEVIRRFSLPRPISVPHAAAIAFVVGVMLFKFEQVGAFGGGPTFWGIHSFSDFLTLLAGRRFADEGFVEHYFTANQSVGYAPFARGWVLYQVPQLADNSAMYYTHYGSVDALVNGILQVVGVRSITSSYYVALSLSGVALMAWYWAASTLFSRPVALISLLAIGSSSLFLTVAESNSAEAYSFQFTMFALLLVAIAERTSRGERFRVAAYAGAWVLGFLQANTNPQFLVLLVIVFIIVPWSSDRRIARSWLRSSILVSGIATGLVVHLLLNAWVLGGLGVMWSDLLAALIRRTGDFDAAVEEGFQSFPIVEFPRYYQDQLWTLLRFDPLRMVLALAATGVIAFRFRQLGLPGGDDYRRQWLLLVAFFVGGWSFILLFVQATVTQPLDASKVLLPFVGAATGLGFLLAWRYWRGHPDPVWQKAAVTMSLAVALGPFVWLHATGATFSVNRLPPSPFYTGGTPDEVRALAFFVRDNTYYGDVVFTNVDTGDDGHRDYPHPAWEYLSERRIEVFETPEELRDDLSAMVAVRASLGEEEPTSSVRFLVLLDARMRRSAVGVYTEQLGPIVASFDTREYWLDPRRSEQYLKGGNSYDLIEVDEQAFATGALPVLDTDPPGASTPWTRVDEFDVLPGGEEPIRWFSSIRRQASVVRGGTIFFYSVGAHGNLRSSESRLSNSRGTTIEIRVRMHEVISRGVDSAILSLADGIREVKVSFGSPGLTLLDQGEPRAVVARWTTGVWHRLRLALVGDVGRLYLDDALVASALLSAEVNARGILFGDFTSRVDDGLVAEIDWVAVSEEGAFAPGGRALGPTIASDEIIGAGGEMEVAGAGSRSEWTSALRFDGVGVGEGAEAGWSAGGFAQYEVRDGIVTFASPIGGTAGFSLPLDIPAGGGVTVEVRMLVARSARGDHDGSMLALQTGLREAKLTFRSDAVEIRDQNTLVAWVPIATGDDVHVYRLTVSGDEASLYVDGFLVWGGTLEIEVPTRDALLLFGDLTTAPGASMAAQLDYLAVSTEGAFAPSELWFK